MSDWNHQQLGDLLDEVHGLELSDPTSAMHPSAAELDAYVEESLSPFAQALVENHLEGCERCLAYVSECFDRDAKGAGRLANVLPFVQRIRSAASPWLAAAAVWVLALPSGVWLSSHFLADPVVIQTRVADTGANESAVPAPAFEWRMPSSNSESPERFVGLDDLVSRAQFEQAVQELKETLGRFAEQRVGDSDVSPVRLVSLSTEDQQLFLEPLVEKFSQLAIQRMVEEVYPDLRQQVALALAVSESSQPEPRNTSKAPGFLRTASTQTQVTE